ncbi:ribonuclease R [Hymenobacter sp. BT683]|uniref:Ribonuclease R n=1 Tax=Hymenobacter jeongseonensis TaxID=2791027 RepID=A0ABS0IC34_9BACT|nr:ribonuclease R [Hymenobacter jeongseonensis]MBF9235919.1 ribonuclease R [Hymenobacter jeongseonensis]
MNTPENPRAPRAKREKPEPAPISQEQVLSAFTENPTKVLAYRQLSRRLGVTTKGQREEIFAHIKVLRKKGLITLLQNDEYRLADTDAVATALMPSNARKSTKKTHPKSSPDVERFAAAEFGQDPVVHRRREAGFDYVGDDSRPKRDTNTVIGTVDLATPNFAFVVPEGTGNADDIRVFTDQLKFALQGDVVRVRLRSSRDGRPVGDVVEVLKRVRPEIVGRLQVQGTLGFVKADNRKVYFDVFVPPHLLHDARNGDKVLVRINEFPEDSGRQPVGEVIRNFGAAGGNEAEINAIMAEFGLPFEFPEEVETESEGISEVIGEDEIARRRDFRNITTFTIDPADAKDFDDALSIQKLENGNWEVGVHIADVTHYVRPGTELEREGKHRATSVYLVDRVIPMLPERLSNGLCSLRPHEDKLTFSAVFELDENGKLYESWFGKTIIHSDRRFSYEEAQERIESKAGDHAEEINVLNDMAHKICAQRFKQGAITFETQEVKFRLDEQGKPLGVYVKERKDAHKMIEEFMLLANRKVAEFVFNLKKTKPRFTMVYRTHDAPEPERLQTFALFAQKFGYKLKLDNPKKVSTELNNLSSEVVGKPEQNVLQGLAIRTMAKAIYSTEPLGHFGLAFDHYSHFTSPIRRYPDMMAHRLLEHYLLGGKNVPVDPVEEECKHSSGREKLAANAERASIKFKQVEFMADEIGNTFKGVVSGLTERGMYIEIEENKCEGMVRLSDIPGDFFELDKDNYRIVGQKTKRIIQFGDVMEVVVKSANLLDRTIDFELVDNRPDHVIKREAEERRTRGGGAPRGYRDYDKSGKGGGMAKGAHKGNKRR